MFSEIIQQPAQECDPSEKESEWGEPSGSPVALPEGTSQAIAQYAEL